jgi:predicted Ser/Thr protein kinase
MDSNIARFEFKQLLGEGSFSIILFIPGKIFQAYDKLLKMDVALKVEKEDKNRKILRLEYEILKNLQGLFFPDHQRFTACS